MEIDSLIRFPQFIDKPLAEDRNDAGFFEGITIESGLPPNYVSLVKLEV